jgi:hypothetical protein
VKLPQASRELREALDALDAYSGDEHANAVADLRKRHDHTIEFVPSHADAICTDFALDFNSEPEYRAVWLARKIGADESFMQWFLTKLRRLSEPNVGCLACYSADNLWKHVGILRAVDRVKSKWGVKPVYDHALSEVPGRYGFCLEFFERPQRQDALDSFKEFVRERHGITQSIINELRR